ncbi:hypothetical protein CH63R_10214 [Colletotrichum higginsianum IMI 349063]|uniref:Uncharacterized protein n=1 Tax=Colletotrichum higginsianum (strain IMI 349063) TaxID=759273 RepID=A0A1B7Y275_COLHI|nr:uncharacterized protein CH63R_10214 [Colletotrichum higginsianum IMI 349063]OBR06094.1 hypothetical protein CH63R_10214 [Colletotrichum higginsianum IMI 349063]
MSASGPAQRMPCMTAEVVKEWTEKDAVALKRTHDLLSRPIPLGTLGYVPKPDNVSKGKYVAFQPWVKDDRGYRYMFVNNLGNSVFVEKSCLVLGRPRLQTPRIVGLDKSFDLAKVRKNLETPWARFLAAFFETCLAAEDSLVRSGVSPEQMGLLKRQNGVPFLVDAIIDGMTRAGTLDLFRNEMPSIDQLSAKGKRLKDFTANDKRKLENTLTLYVIVYVRKNLSQGKLEGLLYGGRTIKGYDRFVQHDDNINSESITKSAINHYQTAKKFENSEVSSSSHFWSSTVAQKISSIVEQLTVSNDPRNPALFPKFGPKAIRGLDHGLNWSSPVMEMFHEEAGLWTRTLIRDANGNPSYWDFKGPPRKVREDQYIWEIAATISTFEFPSEKMLVSPGL